jgi:hypothetical protein
MTAFVADEPHQQGAPVMRRELAPNLINLGSDLSNLGGREEAGA